MSTVQIILLAIRAVKFLQAMEKGSSVETRNNLLAEALPDASKDDVAAISTAMATIDPKFLSKLLTGMAGALEDVLK